MNDRRIEQSYGRCFGRQQLLANSIENFIHMNKKSDGPKFTKFWISKSVSIARVVACFPQASRSESLPAATVADSETPCFCACLSYPPLLCRSAASRALPLVLQSNPSIAWRNSLREWLSDDWQGLKLWLRLSSAAWPTVVKVLSAYLGQLKTPKLKTALSIYPPDCSAARFRKNI